MMRCLGFVKLVGWHYWHYYTPCRCWHCWRDFCLVSREGAQGTKGHLLARYLDGHLSCHIDGYYWLLFGRFGLDYDHNRTHHHSATHQTLLRSWVDQGSRHRSARSCDIDNRDLRTSTNWLGLRSSRPQRDVSRRPNRMSDFNLLLVNVRSSPRAPWPRSGQPSLILASKIQVRNSRS